jgi:hypothetical protein
MQPYPMKLSLVPASSCASLSTSHIPVSHICACDIFCSMRSKSTRHISLNHTLKCRHNPQTECLLLSPSRGIQKRFADSRFAGRGQLTRSRIGIGVPRIDMNPMIRRWRPVFGPDMIFTATLQLHVMCRAMSEVTIPVPDVSRIQSSGSHKRVEQLSPLPCRYSALLHQIIIMTHHTCPP